MVQAAVMREILAHHAWWLGSDAGSRSPPRLPSPRSSREQWPRQLREFKRLLFAARAIRLAFLLEQYLELTNGSAAGRLLCGVRDFSCVWETMLRAVLPGVEHGWNSRLPTATYVRSDGAFEAGISMITDIVVTTPSGLEVVDAKYYQASTAMSAPGLSDIMKQLCYAQAASTVEREKAITTSFVFPSAENSLGPLTKVIMRHRDGVPEASFPGIGCHYVGMPKVLSAYIRRAQFPTIPWHF